MTEPRRRRDRAGRWFSGADSLGPGRGDGPLDGETTGLSGLPAMTGSPSALPTVPAPSLPAVSVTPPEGVHGIPGVAPGVVDVAARGSSGLPGVNGRRSIDGLPPFVEAGPYDSYDPYAPDGGTGSDWSGSRIGAPEPGAASGGPARGPATPPGLERPGPERPGPERAGPERPNPDRPAPVESGPSTAPRAGVGDLAEQLASVAGRLDELARLRRHDVELVDRLHEENGKLRQGELTEAMGPLLRGLIRLHDQMSSLGADDPQSVAGILRKQLLQVLDISADVRPYIAVPGSPFDPTRHLALRGIGTDDPARDRTIARGVRPGFVRGTSTVLRPAEAEVYRHR